MENQRQRTIRLWGISELSFIFVFAFLVGIFISCILPVPKAQGAETNHDILIVYFSRSGNTRELAAQIQAETGGKLIELEPVEPYSADYQLTVNRARQELASDIHPPLKTKIDNIDAYNIILLGSPNWGGSLAPPVKTFLSEYDLSGKTIIPFMTHGGSGLGHTSSDLKSLAPRAILTEGLAVRGNAVQEALKNVEAWVSRLGIRQD